MKLSGEPEWIHTLQASRSKEEEMDRLTLRHRHREAPQSVSLHRRMETLTTGTPSSRGGWTSDMGRQDSQA